MDEHPESIRTKEAEVIAKACFIKNLNNFLLFAIIIDKESTVDKIS
jgi:hypothetical protein